MDDPTHSETSPAERRRLRVRASILDAAERVFAAEGSEGLSIRRLAEEIDYSPAAIYKYFGSKDELIDELKEAFFSELLGQVDSTRLTKGHYLDRARACIRVYIETALKQPRHYMAAFGDVRPTETDACERDAIPQDSNKARAFEYLAGMVAEGQKLGFIRQDMGSVALAMSVWACCHGASSLIAHIPDFPESKPIPSGLDLDGFLDLHCETVLRGLLAKDHSHFSPKHSALVDRKTRT